MLPAHALVTAPSTSPSRWLVFLHGILGSGANWRSFARGIVGALPGWGAVLVDLRLHGESPVGVSRPHTVRAAAEDVARLISALGAKAPVHAVLGHSFGGKVAMALARDIAPDRLFVVDSTPSARPNRRGSEDTQHIVELLTTLPESFESRAAFSAWIEARGVSRPVAMWLAMNVKPVVNTTRFVFRTDIVGIRELLEDYFVTDTWDVLEHPPSDMHTHLVVGGNSNIVDARDLARAEQCPRLTVAVVPDAGHWVHVDAPDTLRDIVLRGLESVPG